MLVYILKFRPHTRPPNLLETAARKERK